MVMTQRDKQLSVGIEKLVETRRPSPETGTGPMAHRNIIVLILCLPPQFDSLSGLSTAVLRETPGTAAANQQERTIDVRAYGAAGDGVADDTPAIAAAIASVNGTAGGTVFFPRGTYALDSAALATASNHSLTITADNVTIAGDGPESCLTITGTSACGLFLARNVDNFHVRDLRIVGNGRGYPSSVLGSVVWYDNDGATAHHRGLWVDGCTIEDCNSGEWIDVHCYAGDYGIKEVRVRDCRFVSRPGNIPLSGGRGVPASNIRIVGPAGTPTNYAEDILISGNSSEATYVKNFLTLKGSGIRNAVVCNNEVYNAGADKATNGVASYAFNYYGGASHINSYSNKVLRPWTCGFYAVSGSHLTFTDNVIVGQVDTADGTLCTGAYGLGSCQDVTIQGGAVSDCGIGVQVQPVTRESKIVIDGVQIRNSGPYSIIIRENATWHHSGGVTVTNCSIYGGDLRIQRGAGVTRLGNLKVENNILQEGQIYLYRDVYDVTIANNQVIATNLESGIFCNGGEGINISNNHIVGPGASIVPSYGILFNRPVQNPSLVASNVISAFQHGLGSANVSASLRNNVFVDVGDRVAGTHSFDLGIDPPGMVAGTMVSYWSCGQYVEDLRGGISAATQAWLVTGPVFGSGCTSTVTAAGDMREGTDTITDVSNMAPYLPGCSITVENAAAGPSTLCTVVESWLVDYSALRGKFQDGEEVEGRTSNVLADIGTDNGASQMALVRVRGRTEGFGPGETIVGQRSGAEAVIRGLALKTTGVCENGVHDAVLAVVAPVWADLKLVSNP
jgi:hypothetical protein